MNEQFIEWAKNKLNDNCVVTKERHGDQSDVFMIETSNGNYFLKIGTKLTREKERLEWLNGKLSVPEVVGFMKIDDKEALLMTAIAGINLAVLKKEWSPEKVVDRLAEVIKKFHAVSTENCPFGISELGMVLVHGDACLPNFIFNGDDFSGYIDLGDMTIGDSEIDLAAAVWSLQHNLGEGYGLRFLEKYGIKNATDKLVEELRLKYEDMQKEWGLYSENRSRQ